MNYSEFQIFNAARLYMNQDFDNWEIVKAMKFCAEELDVFCDCILHIITKTPYSKLEYFTHKKKNLKLFETSIHFPHIDTSIEMCTYWCNGRFENRILYYGFLFNIDMSLNRQTESEINHYIDIMIKDLKFNIIHDLKN